MAQRVAFLNRQLGQGSAPKEDKPAFVPVAAVKTDAASTDAKGVNPENMTMAQRVAALNKQLGKTPAAAEPTPPPIP